MPQATGSGELLTGKNLKPTPEFGAPAHALDASPGGPGSRRRMMFRSVTRSISIHYAIESQKDLAGASIEFDVRQAGNIDAA
ncbi:hypothetical protein [Bradyrhizobium sp. BRP23]|uniref:hypothetical protein n=1 Tax=Bradyrhizobium sp. BRP23 TaxID=2793820 RepID=UPI001CD7941C|nr:hypothetical protein [Bradyrhizobium sp. BRP23]MCA1384706.1 hypothetical protein [Bradyrhizobium sp. BRP05]MCA1421436.1 hypothetical protein [Bradyrhizobium sp. BRP23]